MVQRRSFAHLAILSLLGLVPLAFGHGFDNDVGDPMRMDMSGGASQLVSLSNTAMNSTEPVQPNFFSHSEFSGLMLAHIVSMTIAWFFVLPIGERRNSASKAGSPGLT